MFLELSSAEAAGNRLFVTGNLHTRNVTLSSILLASEDNGVTWSEPAARLRNAGLEQIEFLDQKTGWIGGGMIDPLPRDPFLLITADGGKTWKHKVVFEDTKYGSIAQFHFNSVNTGELILDASQGKTTRQELYATMTGGENWEIRQVSNTPLRIRDARPASASSLRIRADAPSDTYRLEKISGRNWVGVARFKIRLQDCR